MKRLCLILCLVVIASFAISFNQTQIYADTLNQVQVISDCNIYLSNKLDYAEEEGIILELSFGEILEITGSAVVGEDCDFTFYPVEITKDGNLYEGYVITNFVMSIENVALERTLDPNAKTINEAQIYFAENENSKLVINGEETILSQYEEVKIVDGYDKTKEFHKIMFEEDGVIYTGYIKTSDLLVEGFNATVISVVFIFVLVGSIVLSIYLTTRKKRKKQAKKLDI